MGTLMLIEAVRAILKRRSGVVVRERLPHQHNWIHGLPMRVRFKKSRLYISVLPVLVIGVIIGFLGSLLGIGGGFIMVPALVYLLRVPGSVVIGTSLLQVVAMMAATTILQAVQSQSVDIAAGLLPDGGRHGRGTVRRRRRQAICAANNCAACWPCWCWPSPSASAARWSCRPPIPSAWP